MKGQESKVNERNSNRGKERSKRMDRMGRSEDCCWKTGKHGRRLRMLD